VPFNAGAIVTKAKVDAAGFNRGLKGMMKGLGGLTVAAAAVGAVMVKSSLKAEQWQKSLRNVNTLTDEAVINSQEMAKSLIKLDPALGKTIELTDALYQSFSSGAETMDEAMQITVDSAKFAKAGVMDTATAVDVLTTAQNAYGKENMSTAAASDIFFTTIKKGKITGEELATSIGTSIPLFASMGIPLEELSSGMAAMTKQGVNAANSTTQLNAIVNSFLKPSEAMVTALEEQGYASGSALLESEGLAGALEFLEEQSGGSKDALSELLPNTRAVRGALALTGKGGEEFVKILGEMEEAAGATDIAFEEQKSTYEMLATNMEKIELIMGNISRFFIDKIAVGAIQAGTAIVDFINSNRGMEIVSQVVGNLAGGFEFLKTGLTVLVENVLPVMSDLFGTATEILAKFSGEADEGAGFTKLFSVAIQGVSMGLSLLGKVAEITAIAIADLIIGIQQSAQAVGSFWDMMTGKVKFSEVKEQFGEAADAFKNLGSNFMGGIGDLVTETKDQFAGFGVAVEDTVLEISTNIKTTQAATQEYVTSNWDAMITGQTAFIGTYQEGGETIEEETETTSDVIEEENLTLIGKLSKAWKAYFAEAKFSWEGLAEVAQSTIEYGLGAASDLSSQYFTNEEAKLDNAQARKQEKLDADLENGIISQEEYEAAQKTLDKNALADKNAMALKQFNTEKALNIANVGMNAAGSISGWWAQAPLLGPIAGPIWAGTMTAATAAMGIAQAGMIGSQEFVPARRFGGMASGMTRVNEAGGEIISLPDGSQVIPNDISQKIAGGSGGGQTNIFNFPGATIRDDRDVDMIVNKVSRKLGRNLRTA